MKLGGRVIGGLALAVLLAGCIGGANRKKKNLATRIIKSGDALYKERADRQKLDQAIQWYLSGTREFPEDAKVLGRLARAYVVRSYGHVRDGLDGYATARQYGLSCLKMEESFGGLLMSTGGVVTKKAVATLERNRIGCMTWTSLAWSRWLSERGVAGAGIDLGATIALARRAVEVHGDYDSGRPYAALGLATAIALPPMNPDLAAARKSFDKAHDLSPQRLTIQVDLAEYISAPERNADEWRTLLDGVVAASLDPSSADFLENQAAQARAKALLLAGPTDRWMN
jgi:hypothetical protein